MSSTSAAEAGSASLAPRVSNEMSGFGVVVMVDPRWCRCCCGSWPLARFVQEGLDDGREFGRVVHEIDVSATMFMQSRMGQQCVHDVRVDYRDDRIIGTRHDQRLL